VEPLYLFLIRVLNSLCKIIIKLFQKVNHRDCKNQYLCGIKKINIKILNQFNDIYKLVDGSKDENKFLIIFNYKDIYL